MALSDWVVGTDPAADVDIIVHTAEPWFSCRYTDGDIEDDEAILSPLSVSAGEYDFFDFRFPGDRLSYEDLLSLCEEASAAICHIDDVIEDDDREMRELN